MLLLEPVHALVVERRHLAVLLRRQALQPGLARVHDEYLATRGLHLLDERGEPGVLVLVVDADAAFHRDRHAERRHRLAHRGDAVAHQRGLAHQAGAEAARLHAIRRAADVEVDLVVAEIRADPRRLRELARFRSAELQRHRMLGRIVAEQARAVAMHHRGRGDHLGVEQGMRREQAMEDPAVTVGPVHHRGDGKTQGRPMAPSAALIQ